LKLIVLREVMVLGPYRRGPENEKTRGNAGLHFEILLPPV